ncbi:MAG TPA: OmpA family protein [Candidatus Kapabacteria bacterium]
MKAGLGNYRSRLPLEWVVRYVLILFAAIALVPRVVWAQAATPSPAGYRDTVAIWDTLVESSYLIEHKPLRAGAEATFGWTDYYDASFPFAEAGCDVWSMGTGYDFGFRLLADIPFWGDNSAWTFRPGFFFDYQKPQFNWVQADSSYDPTNNGLGSFKIDHDVDAIVSQAGISAAFDYEFLNRWHAIGSANVGIVLSQSYQTSLHKDGPGLMFWYDSTRDTVTGNPTDFPKHLTIVPSLSLGFAYDAPLSSKTWAEPGVELNLPFGGESGSANNAWRFGGSAFWREITLNATLAILFDLTPRSQIVPVFVKREIMDTVRVPIEESKPALSASIRAVAISANGEESPVARMTVEEVRTRNADPILNYIFFDAGSSSFPTRYKIYGTPDEAEREFQGSSERHDVKLMDLYRETLNILGDRMRKLPKAHVTLLGSTDNTGDRDALDRNSDAAMLALARSRAETVKRYLVNVWKIDPNRLAIEATILPTKASPSASENGRAENRRVEIRVDGNDSLAFRMLAPVIVTNIEHLATPDRIDLQPTISAPIARSYATIGAQGITLESFRGGASSVSQDKVWAPTEETLRQLSDSLQIDYDVWDSTGNHAHAHSSIPLSIIHVTSDRPERIERFSLILFGFDESELTPRNGRSIESAVEMTQKIPVERVTIQGFTDEMGDPSHNDALSKERAENVQNAFEQALHKNGGDTAKLNIVSQGLGARELPYDNSLPEGRFFSRTVNITIERQQ